jgi:hypothetical protein
MTQKSEEVPATMVRMLATLTAYDSRGRVVHSDTRNYPDVALLWEHVGCQQNNRKTVRVVVQREDRVEYCVRFSRWSAVRKFSPSARFHQLLLSWGARFSPSKPQVVGWAEGRSAASHHGKAYNRKLNIFRRTRPSEIKGRRFSRIRPA